MLSVIGVLFSIVGFVCWIIILIAAFKSEVWKGLVGFFCWLYLLYFGIVEFDAPNKTLILGGYILGIVGGALLRSTAGAHGLYSR